MSPRVLGLCGVLAALGCGPGRGTATLQGALTATVSLDVVQAQALSTSDDWQLGLVAQGDSPTLNFVVTLQGTAATPGTFGTAFPNQASGFVESPDSAAPNTAQLDSFDTRFPVANGVDGGSFVLTVVSTGTPTNLGGGVLVWNDCHGALTAILLPVQGNGPSGAGTVQLSATF
jgi:hypothetical protein